MIENEKKTNLIYINSYINELLSQTEVTQYFKNDNSLPIELEIVLPTLDNCTITRFEMIKNNKKVISKILEKEKAFEKYTDTISTGNSSLLGTKEKNET